MLSKRTQIDSFFLNQRPEKGNGNIKGFDILAWQIL